MGEEEWKKEEVMGEAGRERKQKGGGGGEINLFQL